MVKPTSTARWGITSCTMENWIIQVIQGQKYRSGGSVSKVSTLISIPPMTLQPVTLRYMRPCVGQIGTAYHQLLVLSIIAREPEMIFPFCRTVFASRPGTFWNQISKSCFPFDSEVLPAPFLVPPPSPRPLVEHVRLQREGADGLYNFWAEQARI